MRICLLVPRTRGWIATLAVVKEDCFDLVDAEGIEVIDLGEAREELTRDVTGPYLDLVPVEDDGATLLEDLRQLLRRTTAEPARAARGSR